MSDDTERLVLRRTLSLLFRGVPVESRLLNELARLPEALLGVAMNLSSSRGRGAAAPTPELIAPSTILVGSGGSAAGRDAIVAPSFGRSSIIGATADEADMANDTSDDVIVRVIQVLRLITCNWVYDPCPTIQLV